MFNFLLPKEQYIFQMQIQETYVLPSGLNVVLIKQKKQL